MEFNVDIRVTGENGKVYKHKTKLKTKTIQEVFDQIKNLKVFNQRLEHEDLLYISDMINKKPEVIKEIKNIFADLENKSQMEMVASSGKYIFRLIKLLKD